jgi:phosphatidylglycerophosphatase A
MRQWIVTFFGAGMSPVAPGTAGSLAAAGGVLLLHKLFVQTGCFSPLEFNLSLIAGMILAGVASVWLGPWAIAHYGREDPGPCVLDEVAGICLTMLCLPVRSDFRELWVVLTAFVAFRIFDVWKPPPCRQLENLPAGWGILTDDLMAAVYANCLSQIVTRFLLG